jgi:hypothetical protein
VVLLLIALVLLVTQVIRDCEVAAGHLSDFFVFLGKSDRSKSTPGIFCGWKSRICFFFEGCRLLLVLSANVLKSMFIGGKRRSEVGRCCAGGKKKAHSHTYKSRVDVIE